uniref:Ig-like domain-containing protein n=1 Tax=Monodelphis domestica TaxID=13616 RepID=F6U2H5_MONDO
MNQTLLILICVGGSSRPNCSHSLPGTLPRPSLRAENGSLVPQGGAVTFQCRGSEKAEFYRLEKMEGSERKGIKDVLKAEIEVEFSLSSVTWSHAGIYYCRYFHSTCWSESSNPLELFSFPFVAWNHAGTYYCLYRHSSDWSKPSDPLELVVTDAAALDYTVGNLVRLILAGLVLILLGILLIEHWQSSRRHKNWSREPLSE